MRRVFRYAAVLCAGLLLGGPAAAIDGTEVIQRLQKQFDRVKTLSARFEKRHYWELVGQTQTLEGRLYVQRPNKFRFESKLQTVVTDGDRAWVYDPANEQVLVNAYEAVEEDRSYEKLLFDLILLGGYADRFEPEYVGEERVDGRRCHQVRLVARDKDAYVPTVSIFADRRDWIVRKVVYENINSDVTTYVLTDVVKDKTPPEGTFTFTPPADVEVIDLR